MEIIIKLQVEDYEEVSATLDITADIIKKTFNVGDGYSSCISATISMDDRIIEL